MTYDPEAMKQRRAALITEATERWESPDTLERHQREQLIAKQHKTGEMVSAIRSVLMDKCKLAPAAARVVATAIMKGEIPHVRTEIETSSGIT